MSAHFTTPTDELLLLAETLGEVKTKADKLEAEFATQARPLEAATNALSAALSGIKALQFHVLDNNLGALSARVEEMRKAVDEQVGVIALELKKADETNAAKAGQEAEALRSQIAALQAQLGTLGAQFSAQLERVEFSAKEEAKKLQLIPGPAGAAGASLNPRGAFIDGETYNRLDVVSWLGSSYIAAVDGVTEKPSKNSNQWQVLASRGGGAAGGAADFGSLAGVAQINQGGTGQTTRAAALNALLPSQTGATQYILLTDGAGTVSWGAQPVAGLPSQTSNGGKLLTTDGTNASWSNAVTVSGSNATVTGTLTVNGATLTSTGDISVAADKGIYLKQGNVHKWTSDGTSSGTSRADIYADSGGAFFIRTGGATQALTISSSQGATFAGAVAIPATTASTTTSTGALVVGNGTSGGLGVGGATNIGGALSMYGEDFTIHNVGYGSWTLRNTAGSAVFDIRNGAGSWLTFPGAASGTVEFKNLATTVKLASTTASTSTSSGALVVSGGVGVAGAINVGASGLSLFAGNADTSIQVGAVAPYQRATVGITRRLNYGDVLFGRNLQGKTSSDNYTTVGTDTSGGGYGGFEVQFGGVARILLGTGNTTQGSDVTPTVALSASTTNATFIGSVTTAAPAGGTAAAWKLGAVATVSPTSPNRTIEVDIGGTIYYIHAKTTNN